jgi:pimeloyl-ACP methyl ester carboxylesterase
MEALSRVEAETDTLTLSARIWGCRAPRVLLIHGLGDNACAWDTFIALAREHLSGISIDLRGHGDSAWDPLQRYGTDDLAADVALLTDNLNLTDLTLVGHSLGAEVAARVAAARPGRISSLALIEGGPELEPEAAHVMQQEMQAMPRKYDSVTQLEALLAMRYPLVESVILRTFATRALRPARSGGLELRQDPAFLRGLRVMDSADYWLMLAAFQFPILLVRGQVSSVLTRSKAAELPRRLQNCRLVELPDAGHAVPLENPGGLCDILTSWLYEQSSQA